MSLSDIVSPSLPLCVQPYAKGIDNRTGDCNCNGGYTGSYCQEIVTWWVPMQWVLFSVSVAIMGILFFWSILKIAHMRFLASLGGKSVFIEINLSLVSVLLNIVGNGFRLALRMVVTPYVILAYDKPLSLAAWVLLVVAHSLSFGLAIASLGSILGFWLDALRIRLFTKMALRTKILCALCAALSLLTVPGAIFAVQESRQEHLLGYGLILVPYCFSAIVFWTITIVTRTGCCIVTKVADLSLPNRAKIDHVNHYAMIASVAWTMLTASVVILTALKSIPGLDTWTIVPISTAMLSESVSIWATMMLVERKSGPFKMVRDFVHYSSSRSRSAIKARTKSSTMDSVSNIETATPSLQKSNATTTLSPSSLQSCHSSESSVVEEVASISDANESSITTTRDDSEMVGPRPTPASSFSSASPSHSPSSSSSSSFV